MSKLYVLFEAPTGYAIFERLENEEIAASDVEYQGQLQKYSAFSKMVKCTSFAPFESPENALDDIVCISEGMMSEFLQNFLTTALPKKSKHGGWELGVADPKLGSAINETMGCSVVSNESVTELLRLCRTHAEKMLDGHSEGDIVRAQCGLGHAFSRNKVKFNVHRSDNMVIQASALLEHMDKGVNLLGMRMKEWYGWHFPELAKEVPDPVKYSRIVLLLGNRGELDQTEACSELKSQMASVLDDDDAAAERIFDKAITSMGTEVAEVDWESMKAFCERVVSMADYKLSVQQYLLDKMNLIAPNLTSLIGTTIGAKLITKAGSLTNLAKSPASTIQILGAEKALFRALKKKKGNTPKYGIIFNSTFIQRATKEHRGKISRYLANKAALACRIDCFMDQPVAVFGDKLKEQVEGRLNFFDTGNKPRSNAEVMSEALDQYYTVIRKREKKRAKKAAAEAEEAAEAAAEEPKKKKQRTE